MSKINFIQSPFINRVINDQIVLPLVLFFYKPAILLNTCFAPPLFHPKTKVVSIFHDATYWDNKNIISKGGKWYYKPLWEMTIKRLSKVICISNSARNQFLKIFDEFDKGNLSVVYNGISEKFFLQQKAEYSPLCEEMKNHSYIISVGTVSKQKNYQVLIDAFAELIKIDEFKKMRLVIVGRTSTTTKLMINENLQSSVVLTGYIDDSEMICLIKNSQLMVFPSLYEGFGFPLLEAMALKKRVVASDIETFQEIGGFHFVPFNPNSPQDLQTKISATLTSINTPEYLDSIEKAFKHARSFTWESTAKKINNLLYSIIENSTEQ